ncbi:MAG TPA: class I SAM-dependent methyltransferase [Burkholderiales bacterium]|nr:class I SAM-dependent methyltransferase [Burkholderiales bacterium]
MIPPDKALERTRVLDVGSGVGGTCPVLLGNSSAASGIDLTDEYCRAAAMLTAKIGLKDPVDFHQGDATNMPFQDHSFDVVWTEHAAIYDITVSQIASAWFPSFLLFMPRSSDLGHASRAARAGYWARSAAQPSGIDETPRRYFNRKSQRTRRVVWEVRRSKVSYGGRVPKTGLRTRSRFHCRSSGRCLMQPA